MNTQTKENRSQRHAGRGAGFTLANLMAVMAVIAVIAMLAALLLPQTAHAGAQTQTDTNALPINSTNTYVLYGDVTGWFTNGQTITQPFIDGSKSTGLNGSVGGFFTNTTANASNINFRIAATVDFSNWSTNETLVALVVPPLSSNWCSTPFKITSSYAGYGLREVANTNLAAVSGRANTIFLKVYSKNGL